MIWILMIFFGWVVQLLVSRPAPPVEVEPDENKDKDKEG